MKACSDGFLTVQLFIKTKSHSSNFSTNLYPYSVSNPIINSESLILWAHPYVLKYIFCVPGTSNFSKPNHKVKIKIKRFM